MESLQWFLIKFSIKSNSTEFRHVHTQTVDVTFDLDDVNALFSPFHLSTCNHPSLLLTLDPHKIRDKSFRSRTSFLYENRKRERERERIFFTTERYRKSWKRNRREIETRRYKKKKEKELERTRVITSGVKRVSNSGTNFSLCATEFQWRGEIMV